MFRLASSFCAAVCLLFAGSGCWSTHTLGATGDAATSDAGPLECYPHAGGYEIGTTSEGVGVVTAVDVRTVSVTLEDGSLTAFRWFRGELPDVIRLGTEVELSVDGPWSRLRVLHTTWSLVAYEAQDLESPRRAQVELPESQQTVSLVERCTAPSDFASQCAPQRVFDGEVTQRNGAPLRIASGERAPSGCDEGTLTFQGSVGVPPCTFTTVDPPEAHTDLGGFGLAFGYSCMFYE